MAKVKRAPRKVKVADSNPRGGWLVSLPHVPEFVIQADNAEQAWDRFKELNGIVATDHRPTIRKIGKGDKFKVNAVGLVLSRQHVQQEDDAELELDGDDYEGED